MKLLIPLGFLGLLAIIALIIIYIIKPNYLQKVVSSTYVWNLSLKYKRKRLPINKILNLLVLICQIIIIVVCSFILAKPVIDSVEGQRLQNEKIVIVDASASMLSETDGVTRYERAIGKVDDLAHKLLSDDGLITVILATSKPEVILQRNGADSKDEAYAAISALNDRNRCSYGEADLQTAMNLADVVLAENSGAEVLLYTATTYYNAGNVTVVDVADRDNEWNAAILDCKAVLDENRYSFSVDVISYGRPKELTVKLELFGVNYENGTREPLTEVAHCVANQVETIEFGNNKDELASNPVYSYDYAKISVEANDSLVADNEFYLYGGKKESLKVLYYSSLANPFVSSTLMALRNGLGSKWNFELTEVRTSADEPETPAISGYDFYIYEHTMPSVLPTDGASFLINPDTAPAGSGINIGPEREVSNMALATGQLHAVTSGMNIADITCTCFKNIAFTDKDYIPLMLCASETVLAVKNSNNIRVAVLAFSLNNSNLPMLLEQPTLLYNMINYFVPTTIDKRVYNVDDAISLNTRGKELQIESGEATNGAAGGNGATQYNETFEVFPAEVVLTKPGTYTLTHTLLSNEKSQVKFFVKISEAESNIFREDAVLVNPKIHAEPIIGYDDLLIYFAAALVALLFVEWLLQAREYF